MLVCKPEGICGKYVKNGMSVFLAGSIDNGLAENWQEIATTYFLESDVVSQLYNPRREVWDFDDQQELNNQINWELSSMLSADIVLVNFTETSKAPITLLELGLLLGLNRNIIVVCPEKFYRNNNVEVTCKKFSIPVYTRLDEGLAEVVRFIKLVTQEKNV